MNAFLTYEFIFERIYKMCFSGVNEVTAYSTGSYSLYGCLCQSDKTYKVRNVRGN